LEEPTLAASSEKNAPRAEACVWFGFGFQFTRAGNDGEARETKRRRRRSDGDEPSARENAAKNRKTAKTPCSIVFSLVEKNTMRCLRG
jgi:ribosome assembly protein YihI (activator of Der GTPase)